MVVTSSLQFEMAGDSFYKNFVRRSSGANDRPCNLILRELPFVCNRTVLQRHGRNWENGIGCRVSGQDHLKPLLTCHC